MSAGLVAGWIIARRFILCGCCARAASGHTVMPPASVMKSRRLMDVILSSARTSFGQPGFAKALNQQLRVCLPAASDPRGYCKAGIGLKDMSRLLTRLSFASEKGESGRETAVTCRIGGVLTPGFLPCGDGLVKATKLNIRRRHPSKHSVCQWVYRAQAHGAFKAEDRFLR